MNDNTDKENIEKLLSLEIKKKMLERNAFGRNISFDELVADVTERSGIPEEEFRAQVKLFAEKMKELCAKDPEAFINVLKEMTGADAIDIIRDDS